MKRVYNFLFLPIIGIYCMVFLLQEKYFKETIPHLQPIPSSQFLRATTGYLSQLVAEIFFVQSAVFLGGLKPGVDPQSYAAILAHNYRQITSLYPEFNDPYYYSQSFLTSISPELTRAVNDILSIGRKAYPENAVFPFYQGFNHFRYLDEPLEAADIFREASQLPEAPPMFAHLAVILSAEEGQLQAGIITLMAMIKSTENEEVKKRYQEEMDMFQAALNVQKAVGAFNRIHQRLPETLNELVPEFLDVLPTFGSSFELTWKPPTVGLRRPKRGK